jgi:16S rRNA (cytidine1402-2'-O)-methyltransferase
VVVVGRELTKLHEEVRRGTLASVVVHYTGHPPLGEVTVALAGAPLTRRTETDDQVVATIQDAVRAWLAAGESRKEVVRRVTTEFGLPRNEAYRLVMDT